MEVIVLSQICCSFHHLTERCRICFMGHYSGDFHRDELSLEHDIRFDRSITLVERPLRLRESLLDHSIGLRVVMTCYTGAYFPPNHSLAARHSKLLCLPSYDVQSHHSQLDDHGYSVWFGVQSHYLSSVWCSESYHHLFLLLAFRATVRFPFGVQSHSFVWHSEPPFILHLVFRAMVIVRHSVLVYHF